MAFKKRIALRRVSVSLMLALAFQAAAADLPKDVQAQLPKGFEVMQSRTGPQPGDHRESLLVVVHQATDTREQPSPRPLLIFERQGEGDFKLIARNDTVVLRADQGGQCDPFEDADEGLAVKGLYFTVENAVSCGSHWSDFVTFRYDASAGRWVFSSEILTSSFPLEGKPDKTSVTRANKASPVSFADWRSEHSP